MALYDNIDSSIKNKKQKLNKSHIRNLKIMNVLNLLVMALLIAIDVFLLIKGIYTGMPLSSRILLILFVVAQVSSAVIFAIKKCARASMITKVGIMIICFLPIIPYIIYLGIGSSIYVYCLIARIICLISLAMLLFNTKTTDDKKTFGVKGIPLAVASIFALVALIIIVTSNNNRKIIYGYDDIYNGYVVNDVLSGKGKVVIKEDTVAISKNALKNVEGNLVIPKNVKYISDDAFIDSKITSLEIYSKDINLMNAINNSNIEYIVLMVEDAKLDLENLNKDIRIRCDRTIVDTYREVNRKYDYLFVPIVFGDEYYVTFDGTNIPVSIFKAEQTIYEPSKSSLPSLIDGRKILYDGYYISNDEVSWPIVVNENTQISSRYSYIYNITYDYSVSDTTYDLPENYYDKLGTISLPILEKEGYQFKGWYNVDEYGNYTKEYKVLDSSIQEDINLKAKFLKEYEITYNPLFSDLISDDEKTFIYTEEDVLNFKVLEKDGFTFEGWYLDSNYTIEARNNLNSDAILYAKWSINEPNITLSDDIDKVYDNNSLEVSVLAESEISDVEITYAFYNEDDELISLDNYFEVINASDSGKYYSIITLNYNDLVITEYKTDYINVKIDKATYDMSGFKVNDVTYTYDSTTHTPSISGALPTGIDDIQITYSFTQGIKNVGVKSVLCVFNTVSPNYYVPDSILATVTIKAREVNISWGSELVFEYDGNMKFPTYQLQNVLESDIDYVSCNTSGSANGVGTHTAKITSLTGTNTIYKNYKLSDNAQLQIDYQITEKTNIIEGISATSIEATYDGKVHLPTVSCPSNVTPIFSMEPINVGTYNVIITFKYEDNDNELIGNVINATVTILQKEIDINWSFTEVTYNSLVQVPTYTITNIVSNDEISLNYSYVNSVNASTYRIEYLSIEGSSKDNYKLPSEGYYEYKINPKTITIDLDNLGFNDQSYTYNGKNQYPTISQENIPSNVLVTYQGYGKNAREQAYNVTAEFMTNSANYVIDSNTKSITINVTISPIVAEIRWTQTSFIFDNTEKTPIAIVNNLLSGDQCEVYVSGGESQVGTHEAYVSSLSNTNYILNSEVKTSFTITQQDYSFNYSFDNVEYTYDGIYHMPTVVLDDEMPDWLTIEYDTEFGIKNVGTLVVTATFISSNSQYTVPSPVTATVTITPIEAQIGFTLPMSIYNGSAIYPTAYVKNLLDGDSALVTLDSGENNINAGRYIVTAIDIDNDNYVITSTQSYQYDILKATYDTSNIQFLNQSFTYNGYQQRPNVTTIDGSDLEIVGLDGVIVTITYSSKGRKDIGTELVTATFTGSSNYNEIAQMTASVTITAKEVTLSWTNTSFVYTGEVLKPTCIISGLVLNDSCDVTVTAQGINVGTYTATASNLTNTNYKLPLSNSCQYTITKATINISGLTFESTEKVYDSTYLYPNVLGAIPENVEIEYTGLSSDAGTHTITVVFNVSENYNSIPSVDVDVTIQKRAVTINWSELEATYTGELLYPKYELYNVISSDSCMLTISGGGIDVGEYTITVIGISNPNYKVEETETITYNIVKADYDMSGIAFNNLEAIYNGLMQSPTISGTLPQGVSVSYSDGATYVSDGTVTVTATFKTSDSNYNSPKSMKATIKIVAKEIEVSWLNTVFDYDGAKHYAIASLIGIIDGDDCEATISGYGINAGSYTCSIGSLSNPNYTCSSSVVITINKIDYDMSSISFNDESFSYTGLEQHQVISGSLESITGLDGISPEVDSYIGSVRSVSDGAVLCTVTFKTSSINYNIPDEMTCYISVSPSYLDITITLDTDSSIKASGSGYYSLSYTYDAKEHTVNISIDDPSTIYSGDTVEFMIDGTFMEYQANGYTFEITSSNPNYLPRYQELYVTVNKFYTGYGFNWNSQDVYWWNTMTDELLAQITPIYTDSSLEASFEYLPTAYGSYKLKYVSNTESLVLYNQSESNTTYDVSLTEASLLGLIDYYDQYDTKLDGIIENYDWIININNLYSELGISNSTIEAVINNSYQGYVDNATFIDFTANNTSSSSICTVVGNINSNVSTTVTYLGHEFSKCIKMETSTTITVDLSNTSYTKIILVADITDSSRNKIRVNGTTYSFNNDIIELTNLSGSVEITKYSTLNLYGIVLL